MTRSFADIHPDFRKAHELLKDNKNYNLTSDELYSQGKKLQGLLHSGVNAAGWKPEKLINSFMQEYMSLNDNKVSVDWYFQCFFIWQRLKGEFDRRAETSGAVRSSKIRELEGMIYDLFQDGIKKYKIKFIRSDKNPKLKIPSNAIECHNFYWWIK